MVNHGNINNCEINGKQWIRTMVKRHIFPKVFSVIREEFT